MGKKSTPGGPIIWERNTDGRREKRERGHLIEESDETAHQATKYWKRLEEPFSEKYQYLLAESNFGLRYSTSETFF